MRGATSLCGWCAQFGGDRRDTSPDLCAEIANGTSQWASAAEVGHELMVIAGEGVPITRIVGAVAVYRGA
jgi:hypothetical protein